MIDLIYRKIIFQTLGYTILLTILACSKNYTPEVDNTSTLLKSTEESKESLKQFKTDNEETRTIEKFYLIAKDKDSIPVAIIKPLEDGVFPVVLSLHGGTASKEYAITPGLYGKTGDLTNILIKAGFAVITFDMRLHGERKTKQYDDIQSQYNDIINNWDTFFPNTINDIDVIYNYLKQRKDLDAIKINIFGYSMGGMFAFALAADHPKMINAVCAASPPINKNLEYDGAVHLSAPKINNVPFLFICGNEDTNYTIADAQWLFSLIPSTQKSIQIFNCGHDLEEAYIYNTRSWFINYNSN